MVRSCDNDGDDRTTGVTMTSIGYLRPNRPWQHGMFRGTSESCDSMSFDIW